MPWTVTLTFPDAWPQAEAVQDYCDVFGYQIMVEGEVGPEPNPETSAQFAYRMLQGQVRDVHKAARLKEIDAAKANIDGMEVTAE